VVQHDLQWIYISGLLQCDFCTAGLLFAYPRKSGSLGFRKTTLWKNIMRALGELKTTMWELLVTLGNIARACFRWFFKLHQNSLWFLFEVVISVLSKLIFYFFFWNTLINMHLTNYGQKKV
jgi:hypothetical protein